MTMTPYPPPILQPKAYADNEDANVKTDTVSGVAAKPKGKFANNKKIKNDTKTETYAGTFDLRQKNKENTAGLILKDSSKTSNTNGLAQNESKKQGMNSSDSANALSNRIKDSVSLAVAKTDILKENKENIDAIVESGQHKPSDSLHAKKSIFDAIAERDEKDAGENTRNDSTSLNRWALTPKVAPVYYNSFSGSGIGPQFDKSNKEGGVNLSYGLQVSYAVNDKLSLRSGVNRVDLSYNTTDVSFAPVGGRRAIASIDYVKNADILSVEGASSQSFINSPIVNPSLEIVTPTVSTGAIQQRLSYYELPLEMEYNLIDNKIGVQLIGGLSSLILKQDEILLRDEDFTTLLGSSNSLNSVSFSTNVGLGFDYNFSSMVQFNLEPMFKYQLNAFKNTVQDFKPYYLGLYTGISIRF